MKLSHRTLHLKKTNSKWIIYQNVKPKPIQPLEENTGKRIGKKKNTREGHCELGYRKV